MGPWRCSYWCVKCNAELAYWRVMGNHGVCPVWAGAGGKEGGEGAWAWTRAPSSGCLQGSRCLLLFPSAPLPVVTPTVGGGGWGRRERGEGEQPRPAALGLGFP